MPERKTCPMCAGGGTVATETRWIGVHGICHQTSIDQSHRHAQALDKVTERYADSVRVANQLRMLVAPGSSRRQFRRDELKQILGPLWDWSADA